MTFLDRMFGASEKRRSMQDAQIALLTQVYEGESFKLPQEEEFESELGQSLESDPLYQLETAPVTHMDIADAVMQTQGESESIKTKTLNSVQSVIAMLETREQKLLDERERVLHDLAETRQSLEGRRAAADIMSQEPDEEVSDVVNNSPIMPPASAMPAPIQPPKVAKVSK